MKIIPLQSADTLDRLTRMDRMEPMQRMVPMGENKVPVDLLVSVKNELISTYNSIINMQI